MLLKNIVGIIIIFFNITGLSILLYIGISAFITNRAKKKSIEAQKKVSVRKPRTQSVKKDKSFEDSEDDLLRMMDLSDLDEIDLDDFK